MRILKYKRKLVEEVSWVENEKVVFLKYLKEEDKPKCECGRIIDQTIDIVENCPNWKDNIEGVDTIDINLLPQR